ncbi:Hypothetical predicted protein [Octopus vulgaris]|uniref:Uncharacterized protein n=1 Tax=Octopus vulgaris TaxID=6645 RepID=A0AA36B4K5_OCTVU|nr:Hypothetical predicted protein [Octopus vulgaris]
MDNSLQGSGGGASVAGDVDVVGVDGVLIIADIPEIAVSVVAGVFYLPAFTDFAIPVVDDAVVARTGVVLLAGH